MQQRDAMVAQAKAGVDEEYGQGTWDEVIQPGLTTMWDDNWRTMIAGSKFKEWPGFGTYKKGKIALQDHGDDVWYRNIKIRKL